jgi:hypothetical protein
MTYARRPIWLLAAAAILAYAFSTQACPFCEEKGLTLVGQFEEAQFVLFGHFTNAKLTNTGLDQGESDFVIEKVLKDHDAVKGKTKLTLPRYITDSKTKFIIFCDVYKGKIDPYKGMPVVNGSEMGTYIEGVLKLKGKSQPERLRYAFDFLNSSEVEVAMDAYREFAKADYKDYKDIAKKLPAATIAGWLTDPKTPPYRYGLYASLLGHCGNEEHAKLLRGMIDDPEKRKGSGLHGLMASYVMLKPKEGWSMLKELVQAKDKPFLVRYSGLQTMRFIWDNRPELIAADEAAAKTEIVKGVAGVLEVTDMADFAIEDLRKWRRWEYADKIIGLYGQKNYNTPIIRKSILRYALQCPSANAVAFVEKQKARDAEWVSETRELLDLETAPAPATSATVPAAKEKIALPK